MNNRRKFLRNSLSAGIALNFPTMIFGQGSDGIVTPVDTLRRIAFGSCCKSWKPQNIWSSIADTNPDLFLFLGDTVYTDDDDVKKHGAIAALAKQYRKLSRVKEFRQFRKQVPIHATWDDHDYGIRESGADFAEKELSRKLFLDFWGAQADDLRRTQLGGIYTSYEYGSLAKRAQIILLDTRFGRSPLLTTSQEEDKQGRQSGFGPYRPNADPKARILDDVQWQWLEKQLSRPARFRIISSSVPFSAGFRGWESWANFPLEKQRFINIIKKTKAEGVIFLSGDIHYGELSCERQNVPYPLWDLTSSGLTHYWPSPGPNSNRVVPNTINEINFGLIHLLWDLEDPVVVLEIRNKKGDLKLQQSVRLGSLRVS
jgi:alkaline phosphatase D